MSHEPPAIPDPDDLEASVGPRETIVFDQHGELTTIPSRWWAAFDRHGDPAEELVDSIRERASREQ
jgi:hypothetical protein